MAIARKSTSLQAPQKRVVEYRDLIARDGRDTRQIGSHPCQSPAALVALAGDKCSMTATPSPFEQFCHPLWALWVCVCVCWRLVNHILPHNMGKVPTMLHDLSSGRVKGKREVDARAETDPDRHFALCRLPYHSSQYHPRRSAASFFGGLFCAARPRPPLV